MLLSTFTPFPLSVRSSCINYPNVFLDKLEVAGRRIAKFTSERKAVWEMQHDYEARTSNLINNINSTVNNWDAVSFNGTYEDAKHQMGEFIHFKNTSKREWVAEKRELDTLLGNIQTKLKTYNLTPYSPPQKLSLAVCTIFLSR